MPYPIPLYNRKTQEIELEKVFKVGFMHFVYGTELGLKLENAIVKWPAFSKLYGILQRRSATRKQIAAFVEQHEIDPSELLRPLTDFRNFNDFFIRQLKPEARPFDSKAAHLVSPCDGRLLAFNINNRCIIPVKGKSYSLTELLKDETLAKRFDQGIALVLRLAPMDYHRFHYIDSGVQQGTSRIKGVLHSVSPLALRNGIRSLVENKRHLTTMTTKNFGLVAQVDVGALVVGRIKQHHMGETPIQRGQEKGFFELGGSTIVMLFEPNRVAIDEDLIDPSNAGIESLVKLGEKIGRASRYMTS